MLPLHDILFRQGFGTRRVCWGLIQKGQVAVGSPPQTVTDPESSWASQGLPLRVQGLDWVCHEPAYLMLHKPAGYECSRRPGAHPGVHTLLPPPLRQRGGGAAAGVQAVGRLDQDTTGLLLLSDDGAFIHRLTSPRHHVPKVYRVHTARPLDDGQLQRLRAGVMLDGERAPVRAAAAEAFERCALRLTLTEGKYHQVKRMLAAVGNHVEALHRESIGALVLPPELAPGQWRWLDEDDLVRLQSAR